MSRNAVIPSDLAGGPVDEYWPKGWDTLEDADRYLAGAARVPRQLLRVLPRRARDRPRRPCQRASPAVGARPRRTHGGPVHAADRRVAVPPTVRTLVAGVPAALRPRAALQFVRGRSHHRLHHRRRERGRAVAGLGLVPRPAPPDGSARRMVRTAPARRHGAARISRRPDGPRPALLAGRPEHPPPRSAPLGWRRAAWQATTTCCAKP